MLKAIPKGYHDESKGTLKLLWEEEWRALGITQVSRAVPFRGSVRGWKLTGSRVSAGSTTKSTSRSPISFSSSE